MFLVGRLVTARRVALEVVFSACVYEALQSASVRQQVDARMESVWERSGRALVHHATASMAVQLEARRAEAQRATTHRDVLVEQLQNLRTRWAAAIARATRGRIILKQIIFLFEQPDEQMIVVDGKPYDRTIIERDARNHLRACVEADAEAGRLSAVIAESCADVAQVDLSIHSAEKLLDCRDVELAALRARADGRAIRQGLALLGKDETWDCQTGYVRGLLDRLAAPAAVAPMESQACSGVSERASGSDVAAEIDGYLLTCERQAAQ